MADRRGRAGFTLIEILVALAILAATLGFAFEAISGGFSGLERARREQDALQLAQSLLARIGHDIRAHAGHAADTEDGFAWTVDIDPALIDPPPAGDLAAYPATVTVLWQDAGYERRVRLASVRLGPRDEPR